MMSTLVKGLLCLECSAPTLKIRAVDRRLGLVCLYETYCTTCGAVLNSTLSSDRTDKERAGNPFVVVRQAVAATMDMGVGHAGLVKLCRFMDMAPIHHRSYARHVRVVTAANMKVVSSLMDDSHHSASGLPRARPVCHTRLHPRSDRDLRRIVDDEGTQFIVWHWLCRGRHDRPRLGLDSALLVLPALRVCQKAI